MNVLSIALSEIDQIDVHILLVLTTCILLLLSGKWLEPGLVLRVRRADVVLGRSGGAHGGVGELVVRRGGDHGLAVVHLRRGLLQIQGGEDSASVLVLVLVLSPQTALASSAH